jgi:hypothetical protein
VGEYRNKELWALESRPLLKALRTFRSLKVMNCLPDLLWAGGFLFRLFYAKFLVLSVRVLQLTMISGGCFERNGGKIYGSIFPQNRRTDDWVLCKETKEYSFWSLLFDNEVGLFRSLYGEST